MIITNFDIFMMIMFVCKTEGLKINALDGKTVQSQYIYCCIGLYRENAIAIQKESGDSDGGNV